MVLFLYKDKQHTIKELELLLQFQYLPHICFENHLEQQNIKQRGLEKFKRNEVSPESQELGNRFIKKIKKAYISKVSIHKINDKVGFGLFTEEDLKTGSYIGEYTGVVCKNERDYLHPLNNYRFIYPVNDDYQRPFCIDATKGNLTRFINHSFTPNLEFKFAFYDYFYHVIFLATREIKKGEQLFYNYGKSYWNIRPQPLKI